MKKVLLLLFLFLVISNVGLTQSTARIWNNFVLESIRNDYARPTVHARNLFHHSVLCYDAWAAYDLSKETYFLGKSLHGYLCDYTGIAIPVDIASARDEAVSFASYRFIRGRYQNAPGFQNIIQMIDNYMASKGYDISNTSLDYENGGPAELGNYLANEILTYGLLDGSNESINFASQYYFPSNPPIEVEQPGNPDIVDPNHWQPITLSTSIDQSGNIVQNTPPHLTPEWGEVNGFSLLNNMYTELIRDGDTYKVYFDQGGPALLTPGDTVDWNSFYKWNHTLVSIWQSHLDTADNVMWDISPAASGNNTWYPTDPADYPLFYDLLNGGDPGTGHALNPVTGLPYLPQIVRRGDYARVLAEFWADGMDSETPPGHWFEIYHYVIDQPLFERKWQGVGPELDELEFDVKAQLALGGAMHDAAICAWSLKGYYDYIRPVSAIRFMADQGQSSDTLEMSFHPDGIPLLPGFVEVVHVGDPLAGTWNEHVGKIKLYTWKGHDYISNPLTDQAGVGWILAENWWPYQRPSFVTPPFSGYVSGHSTFSRAAAEMLTFITGDPFFPGGMGEFVAEENEFLHFEEGPSETITLQWATYRDASDQCSLSRIWGGIHPPVDDMAGRFIGEQLGNLAFTKADSIFTISKPAIIEFSASDTMINRSDIGSQFTIDLLFNVPMDTSASFIATMSPPELLAAINLGQVDWVDSFNLQLTYDVLNSSLEIDTTFLILQNLQTGTLQTLDECSFQSLFVVDTKKPMVAELLANYEVISDLTSSGTLELDITFSEICDTTFVPAISFESPLFVNPTVNLVAEEWVSVSNFRASYNLVDYNESIYDLTVKISDAKDSWMNVMDTSSHANPIVIDTRNPQITVHSVSDALINQSDLGVGLSVTIEYDEFMDTSQILSLHFESEGMPIMALVQDYQNSYWQDTSLFSAEFIIYPSSDDLKILDLVINNATDTVGNYSLSVQLDSVLYLDLSSPTVLSVTPFKINLSDSLIGLNTYYVDVLFNERMDTLIKPLVKHEATVSLTGSIQYNIPDSYFLSDTVFRAKYNVIDQEIEVDSIDVLVNFITDFAGNSIFPELFVDQVSLDTRNPLVISILSSDYFLDVAGQNLNILAVFDEPMFPLNLPFIAFDPPSVTSLFGVNSQETGWVGAQTYQFTYSLDQFPLDIQPVSLELSSATDLFGNPIDLAYLTDYLTIQSATGGTGLLSQSEVLIYPNVVKVGDEIIVSGIVDEIQQPIPLISISGQLAVELSFVKVEDRYHSEKINVSPGIYFLAFSSGSKKLIVVE